MDLHDGRNKYFHDGRKECFLDGRKTSFHDDRNKKSMTVVFFFRDDRKTILSMTPKKNFYP